MHTTSYETIRRLLAMSPHQAYRERLAAELSRFVHLARVPMRRTMRQWAEQEVKIPDGPFKGLRFNANRQPANRLWLDAIDSHLWHWHWLTAPTQNGKSLLGYVIPALYHIFELGEKVVCGLPMMDMARDKWKEDFLPVIEESRYRDLLPRSGGGSRGGFSDHIQFNNGGVLRFMGGGGNDKTRSAYSARVLVMTEVDGLDESSESSAEADKTKQLAGRLLADPENAIGYGECTVSFETGKIWREYNLGTASQIMLECPHCHGRVCPDREHLVGYETAQSELEAKRSSFFACPACGEAWSEEDRRIAHATAFLLHRGQKLDEAGNVVGPMPETDALGFRWSAVNNFFLTAGYLGQKEWLADRDPDEDNAEKEMCQFFWAKPYVPPEMEEKPLEAEQILKRVRHDHGANVLPQETLEISVGVDVGKWIGHWFCWAFLPEECSHVPAFGEFQVPSDKMPPELAILYALRQLREYLNTGWAMKEGGTRTPDAVWVDSNYMKDPVRAFVKESNEIKPIYKAVIGQGQSAEKHSIYQRPKQVGSEVKWIGEEYDIKYEKKSQCHIAYINVDHWKTKVANAFQAPVDQPGAATVYHTLAGELRPLAKALVSERPHRKFEPGVGYTTKWLRISRENHKFDAAAYARAAGHFVRAWEARQRQIQQHGRRPPRGGMPLAMQDQ